MAVTSHSNITATDFWNLPPPRAFETALTQSRGKKLQIKWPAIYLPSASYYIALYFQDNRNPSPYSWRVFSVTVDGKNFYKNLNVSTSGVAVFGTQWPLAGQTEIVLTPDEVSPVGPVINAGEILQIVPLGGRTIARDGIYLLQKLGVVCLIGIEFLGVLGNAFPLKGRESEALYGKISRKPSTNLSFNDK